MANVVLGSDLMLFTSSAETGTFKALGAATSCKLTIQANTLETSSKDSGCWVSKQAAKLSWNASTDNLFVISDYKSLVEAMLDREEIYLQFGIIGDEQRTCDNTNVTWAADTSKGTYEGKAIITSIDMNAADNENATYTVSFEGVGALEVK